MEITDITCIRATNSVDFVEKVFSCYRDRDIFAISSHANAGEFETQTGLSVRRFIEPAAGGGWLHTSSQCPTDDSPAQIVFTSGTEGQPKAIVLSYANLNDVVQRVNHAMEVHADIREYIGVPVYHSFGLGRCRAVTAAGGHAYIPEAGFNLKELQSMLADGAVNAVSAVPSLWRAVLDNAASFESVAYQMRWIEIGSQYMSPEEKRDLRELFPQANIVQHYGLTEASRTTLLRVDSADESDLQSVGAPDKATQLALADDGRLKIRGPHVARGRLEGGTIVPLVDKEGWFVTSDLAEIHEGRLYYRGRADDVINVSGMKFDPANIEAEINKAVPAEDHVALCRIPDELRGDGVLAAWPAFSARSEQEVREAIDKALSARNIHAASAVKVYRVDQIPTTATGKIKRKAIADTYVRLKTATKPEPTRRRNPQSVEELYKSVFSTPKLDPDHSFISLGGGSLNYIMVSVALERILGELPQDWDKLSVAQLTAMERQNSGKAKRTAVVETGVAVRAYAVTAVVINHAGEEFLAGGAALLMLAAGLNFCRFQWQGCLSLKFGALARSILINVLVPFWALLILFPLLKGRPIDYTYVFLFGNNVPGDIPLPFPAWFVAALVQGLLIFVLPLLISPVRQWAQRHSFSYGLSILVLAIAARLMDEWMQWGASANLNGMQISWVLWLFALGFCAHSAGLAPGRKWLVSAMVVGCPLLFYHGDWSRIATVSVGSLLLIWVPTLRVPRFFKPPIGMIGSASLFIYLMHSRAPIDLFPSILGVDWFRIVAGIGIGVLVWYGYSKFMGLCSTRWSLMNDPKKSRDAQ